MTDGKKRTWARFLVKRKREIPLQKKEGRTKRWITEQVRGDKGFYVKKSSAVRRGGGMGKKKNVRCRSKKDRLFRTVRKSCKEKGKKTGSKLRESEKKDQGPERDRHSSKELKEGKAVSR